MTKVAASEGERDGAFVRLEIVLGDRDAHAVDDVGPSAERRHERPEVHRSAVRVRSEGFGERAVEVAGRHRARDVAGIQERVPAAAVVLAVLRDAIERLVLAHAAVEKNLEDVFSPRRRRQHCRAAARRNVAEGGARGAFVHERCSGACSDADSDSRGSSQELPSIHGTSPVRMVRVEGRPSARATPQC